MKSQLTQWGTATLTYDANGNMFSDGTNSYFWDARNQLTSMNAGIDTFQYDPFGRRVAKTIAGATTSFLYDGPNPVQELSGTTVTANLLTGGLDEDFTRTDSAGARHFLADPLGSTVALTDSTGVVQTVYTYEPFGNIAISGAARADPYQYADRENDGTGLYFYRARYYNPMFGRFISQDAIGLIGGINVYAYVGGGPTNFRDATGLPRDCFTAACGGMPKVPPPPPPLNLAGRKPKDAATQYCRDNGEFSFNIPFTHVPVTVGLSATGGPANVSSTGDLNTVVPVIPWPDWLGAGASVDITINAPGKPSINPSVGWGKNLSLGYFTGPSGPQGISLNVGPSIGPPVNVSIPTNNFCGMAN